MQVNVKRTLLFNRVRTSCLFVLCEPGVLEASVSGNHELLGLGRVGEERQPNVSPCQCVSLLSADNFWFCSVGPFMSLEPKTSNRTCQLRQQGCVSNSSTGKGFITVFVDAGLHNAGILFYVADTNGDVTW